MFDQIRASWGLVKASFAVLKADKELLIFPLISGVGLILVTLTFAIPLFFSGILGRWAGGRYGAEVLMFVVAFLYYIAQYFVIFFANSALVGAAMIRLKGGDPTVGDGLRIAWSRAGAILGYALISATVGMILRAISERGGIIGQIASAIFGAAWSVVTFLAVPILVVEGVGPVEAIKRSGSLLKRTWGEQIVGNLSINLIIGLLAVLVILAGIGLAVLAAAIKVTALVVVAIALAVVAVLVIALVGSAMSGIYAAAVYCYATDGSGSAFFDPNLMRRTFKEKQRGK
jgi:hypothetical protein